MVALRSFGGYLDQCQCLVAMTFRLFSLAGVPDSQMSHRLFQRTKIIPVVTNRQQGKVKGR